VSGIKQKARDAAERQTVGTQSMPSSPTWSLSNPSPGAPELRGRAIFPEEEGNLHGKEKDLESCQT